MEHNVVENKGRNNSIYLHALKNDFDTVWLCYAVANDDDLNEEGIKIKHQMIDLLEEFFDELPIKKKKLNKHK